MPQTNIVVDYSDLKVTAEYAAGKKVMPQTVRKRYSQTGSYFGDVPVKAPNGRLLWP